MAGYLSNSVLWPTAAKKGGKWYRGVVEAAECFMTRWHRDEAESSWLHHTTEHAKSDDKGRGGGKVRGSRIDTAVDECRNEMIDRVARRKSASIPSLPLLCLIKTK